MFDARALLAHPTLSLASLAWLSCVMFLGGCGHKATAADCQLIVDRNVEVEMKGLNITDPAAIAKRKMDERNDPKTKADLDGCIGKRITDSMMSCVNNAQTGEEIDQCIR